MTYEVYHDRENCIGCGTCADVCPKYWEMSDDGKSQLLNANALENRLGWEYAIFDDGLVIFKYKNYFLHNNTDVICFNSIVIWFLVLGDFNKISPSPNLDFSKSHLPSKIQDIVVLEINSHNFLFCLLEPISLNFILIKYSNLVFK